MPGSTHPALVGVAVAAFALTAGCGVLGGGTSSPSAPAPSAPAATAPATAPAPTAPATPDPGQPTPADPSAAAGNDQLGSVVATRTSAVQEQKVTMRLYPVQREGTVSHLNLTLSSPAQGGDHVQVAELLSDRNLDAIDKDPFSADGLTLVDGKNAKLYLVASDGSGTCLCSRGLASVFLEDDVPQLFSSTFAAPPADVTTVDVRVPGFGTVKSVPVQ